MKPHVLHAMIFAALALHIAGCRSTKPPVIETRGEAVPFNHGASEAPLGQFLATLSAQRGVAITPLGGIEEERVNIAFDPTDRLETILNNIATPRRWTWVRFDDGSYGIANEEWIRANTFRPSPYIAKVFRPDHIKASEAADAIRPLLTPGYSRVTADDRTNKILVVDTPEILESIEHLIHEIDAAVNR